MGRGTKLLAVLLLAALALAPTAAAELTAESMYRPGTVVSIKLALPKASIEQIEAEGASAEEYAPGTFSLAETEGSPATTKAFSTPVPVGIKLKGNASYVGLGGKSAFKLKFEGQPFLGLQKMTLNNMVQDASMLHETMAYDVFRANRVPATNTGFAYVHVILDGHEEDFGMHLNVETYDQVALEKRFGPFVAPPQHLYAGEYHSDVTPSQQAALEVSEGKKKERVDLERLIAAVGGTSPADFSERVAPYVDLQEMVHQWAVEKYVGHWDGYAGQQGAYQPNNYYLFSSAGGVFQMLPWGTDQTWGVRLGFDGGAGVLFDDCLADASCATMYRRALRELQASLPGLELDSLAARTAALLEPWQAMEASPRKPADASTIKGAVEATRGFAATRPAELQAFLAGQPAEAKATRILVTPQPATLPAGGGAGTLTMNVSGAAGEPIFGEVLSLSSSDPHLSFGPVVDEGEGVYTSSFSGAPAPGPVTITATDATAGISGSATLTVERAVPAVPAAGSSKAAAGNAAAAGTKPVAPLVRLGKRPRHRTSDRRPLFTFASDQTGSSFVCRLGHARFRPCSSPVRLPRLSRGHHVFTVVAVGPEGLRGVPRRYEFFVSIRRRTRVPD